MTIHDACEQSYKNGYEDGKLSNRPVDIEIATRIKVAYEQLGKCFTVICRNTTDRNDALLEDFRETLNKLLNIQVKLGMIKREEDIK